MNLQYLDMQDVKDAVDIGDYPKAGEELRAYFIRNKALRENVLGIPAQQTSSTKPAAAEALLNRTYTFQGVTHTFENGIDWLYNPTGRNGIALNPEWVVNTVRFRGLPVLANAYRTTKDERYAVELVYLMTDFIKKFPVPLNETHSGGIPSEFDNLMYSKLSVSSRLRSTVYSLFAIIESPSLDDDSFVTIMQGIYNHLLRMEKFPYLNYHNMGVTDAKVILEMAVVLPELNKSQEWMDWGWERGLDQMNGVVYPDGVEKELCPSYHTGVMNNFASFMEIANAAGNEVPSVFVQKLQKMAGFLMNLARPDGYLPAFNEVKQSDGASTAVRSRVRNIANATNENGVLRWYASSGSEGTPPEHTSTSFDWAGYYVMRSGWDRNANYMAIKAGPYGLAHQQEDKLSFELSANGEPFLIDPGFYTYDSGSIWRKYFRSSLAHNTVVPNGLSQMRNHQRSLWENNTLNDAIWLTNEKYDFLSAKYESGYAELIHVAGSTPSVLHEFGHQRDVLFIKPGLWLMIDWMDPGNSDENLYEALFQSQYPMSVSGKNLFIRGNQSGLYILPIEQEGQELQANVASEQLEPVRRGWIYKADSDQLVSMYAGAVAQRVTGKAVQAYFIVPGERAGSSAYTVRTFAIEGGGIGGELTGPDGKILTFIAQQEPGNEISGSGLVTRERICVVAEDEQWEVELDRKTHYVNAENTASGDGLTWEGAHTDLQAALDKARYGDQIWVAKGVYTPTVPADPSNVTVAERQASFRLSNGVAVYGGFAGTEISLDERDWKNNLTILSGDIDRNDEAIIITTPTTQIKGRNSYNVVNVSGTGSSAILDGFTITGGSADDVTFTGATDKERTGGGIYNSGGSPLLRNLDVSGNQADSRGGGLYVVNGTGHTVLTNVTIRNNRVTAASSLGGGIFNAGRMTITNSEIAKNVAGYGGGFHTWGATSTTMVNVLIYGNEAIHTSGTGGGIRADGADLLSLTNVTISGNKAATGAGIRNQVRGSTGINALPIINNSIIWGNTNLSGTENSTINVSNVNASNGINVGVNSGKSNNNLINGNDGGSNIADIPSGLTVGDLFEAPAAGIYLLRESSPAIDAGSNEVLWSALQSSGGGEGNPMPTKGIDAAWGTDLDGNRRVQGTNVDIGAFERSYAREIPVLNVLWSENEVPEVGIKLRYGDTGILKVIHSNTDLPAPVVSVVSNPEPEPLLHFSIPSPGTFDATAIRSGESTLIVSLEETDFFEGVEQVLNIQVDPVEVVVTAAIQHKVYGKDDPELTFTAVGLINDDTESTAFSGSLSREEGENVGVYAIGQGTLSSSNYTIHFTGAEFSITKAGQQISLSAPGEVLLSDGVVELPVSSNSNLPVTLAVDDVTVATVSAHSLVLYRGGLIVVTATQAGDDNHEPADPVKATIEVVNDKVEAVQVNSALSPNGDGINDILVIQGIHRYPDNKMIIFDQYGKVRAEIVGYDNRRNVFSGEGTLDGTYFYKLEYLDKGRRKRMQGFFTLKRN